MALSLYRWTDGDPGLLGKAFIEEAEAPVVVTGLGFMRDYFDRT